METEIIKPNKNNKPKKEENKSILTPIIYLIIGIILAFKNESAVKFIFYIIGIFIIIYGIKSFITYYKFKDKAQYKNINISLSIASIIIGSLFIILSEIFEKGIRYAIGFFFIYMGISRLLTSISFNEYKNLSTISNIVLIIIGLYSIFVSNVILVIIGWILIINALILFWDYLRR